MDVLENLKRRLVNRSFDPPGAAMMGQAVRFQISRAGEYVEPSKQA